MAKSRHYYIRRSHRYLGVILGVQFLMWTISGLYFSWTDIDEIHGDFHRKPVPNFSSDMKLISPDVILHRLQHVDSINSLHLTNILNTPYYAVSYYSGRELKRVLGDAVTGTIRQPVTKEEAIQIAAASFSGMPVVEQVEYLTTAGSHHEYREKPLPAWAVTFKHPSNTTVYVSSDFGKVESFRNNKWRIFDFLWMMHTMDYKERDNINNWLLRIFSLFGLLTIFSGFLLFWISSKRKRRKNPFVADRYI